MTKVLFSACDEEIRKSQDDLDRHRRNHHKDRLEREEKATYKFPSQGSCALDKHFTVVEKKKDV